MADVDAFFEGLRNQMRQADADRLKREIHSFVPEYTPYLS
jgi:hypothetical protein